MALVFVHNGVTYVRGNVKANASMSGIRAASKPRFRTEKVISRHKLDLDKKLDRLRQKLEMLRQVMK